MKTVKQRLASIQVDEQRLAREMSSGSLPSRRYIIYMTPRTGSSWLRDLLLSADLFGWPQEWFNVTLIEKFARSKNCNSVDTYANLSLRQGQSTNGVYGVAITWESIATLWPDAFSSKASSFFHHFPSCETQSFMLARRDIVAQAVSLYRLRRTGIFDVIGSTPEQRASARSSLPYDEIAINACLDELVDREQQLHKFFEYHKIRPHALLYEDITRANPEDIARYFAERILPDVTLENLPGLASRHRKVGDDKNKAFSERFRLDHLPKVTKIEEQREKFLSEVDYLADSQSNSYPMTQVRENVRAAAPPRLRDVTVILPVYSGLRATIRCLNSVLGSTSTLPFRLLVIYDAGPDPRVEAYLESLAENNLIELVKNDENEGFVKTVNRGFKLANQDDVIILNSDTEVTGDWIDRIVALADTDPKIATITPLTNNGEIASFPNICNDNHLPAGFTIANIDSAAAATPSQAWDIPTGVGFCLFISRSALEALGAFDAETFGRGYGEETDFCRRAASAGWRNVLQTNIFVFHQGGVSFGTEKTRLLEKADRTIEKRYPGYHRLIELYCREDQLRAFRFHFILRCLAQKRLPTILVIAHGEGGGTRRYIQELRRYFRDQLNILWLEPECESKVRLIFPTWASSYQPIFDTNKDKEILFDILRSIGLDMAYVNHLRGIEAFAQELLQKISIRYNILLHDYYFIASSPTLTNDQGIYDIDSFKENRIASRDPHQALKIELLQNAGKVIAPSKETANIYNKFSPGLEIHVHEHIGSELIPTLPPVKIPKARPDGRKRVAILGALGPEKGADVLERVAEIVRSRRSDVEFHLIGFAYRELSGAVTTHGRYEENKLPQLVDDLSPDLVWFPCQWPETYSYTLTAAMERGVPLLVPSFGAFVSRTEGRPFTWHIPFNHSPEQYATTLLDCLEELESEVDTEHTWSSQPPSSMYYTTHHDGFLSECASRSTTYHEVPAIDRLEELFIKQSSTTVTDPDLPVQQTDIQRLIEETFWKLRSSDLFVKLWSFILPRNIRTRLRMYILGR